MMGLDRARGAAAARLRARLRRAARVRRPQAQELLVGDDGPARVRGDGRGRRRHHARRRGAGGRRRLVRPEVHGRLPREARGAGKTIVLVTHDMATVQSALRPRDAAPRRRAAVHRRPRGDGAALLPAELRRAGGTAERRRRGAGRQRPRRRRVARERGRRAGREPRAGRADRASTSSSRRATTSRRRCSASTSSTPTASPCSASTARSSASPTAWRPAAACGSRGADREPAACPGATRQLPGSRATARRATSRCTCVRLLDFVVYGTRPGPGSVSVRADVEAGGARMSARRRRSSCATSAARPRWAAAGERALELLYLIAVTEFKRHLPRHRARLPVVARAAADAVRRPADGVHAGVPPRRPGAALPGAAAVQHRAVRLLPGGDGAGGARRSSARRRWCARRSSRGS